MKAKAILTFVLTGLGVLTTTPAHAELKMTIGRNAFDVSDAQDQDGDCMDDSVEYRVASFFKPYLIFDSRENTRLTTPQRVEPLVLFRVTPTPSLKRPDCKIPKQIRLKFGFLFADDGGYVTSFFCGDRHRGDNESMYMTIDVSEDGKTFTLHELSYGIWHWPHDKMRIYHEHHPVFLMSAGKHHAYLDTRVDGKASPYSKWNCREGMNAKGARILPTLESDQRPTIGNNVGEPWAHPDSFFVGNLAEFGFKGEQAWGTHPFCGGHSAKCGHETGTLSGMWGK